MTKAKLKTQLTQQNPKSYINAISNEEQKKDALKLLELMKKISKTQPQMWGNSIVGFGIEHLKYESGRELDWFKIGFSARKNNLSLYILRGGINNYLDLLEKLGPYKTGVSCLYIKNLDSIDQNILTKIITRALKK